MRRLLFFGSLALSCAFQPGGDRQKPAVDRENHPSAAPWLEMPSEPWTSDEVYQPGQAIIALGAHLALVEAEVGHRSSAVLLDETRGVVGIVELGDVLWIGVDGDDALYRVSWEGVFERAPDAVAAASGRWEKRATVPGAEHFAAAGSVVAAASKGGVFVSTDGAETFRSVVLRASGVVESLFVRHDGVLVAAVGRESASRELFVSRDRGTTWALSTLQVGSVQQFAAWISAPCAGAVLSSDGKTWVEGHEDIDVRSLGRAIQADDELVAYGQEAFVNQTSPPPPEPGSSRAIAGRVLCNDGWHTTRAPKVRMGSSVRCNGVECLLYRAEPYPFPTRTRMELFFDGLCAPSDADEHGECRVGEPLVRTPHVLVVDHDENAARVVAVPVGCRPSSVRFGGGLAVLACSGETAGLFSADPAGVWSRETTSLVPDSATSTHLQVASDGTALFRDGISDGRIGAAWLRSPLPLGARDAWRLLTYPDAVGYSVAPGGEAVVVTSAAGDRPDHFTVWRDERSGTRKMLGHGALGDASLKHVCARGTDLRFLVETPSRFELRAMRDGRFVLIGALPFSARNGSREVLEYLSSALCSPDAELASELTNGAERP